MSLASDLFHPSGTLSPRVRQWPIFLEFSALALSHQGPFYPPLVTRTI
jgi:hypothetical protein